GTKDTIGSTPITRKLRGTVWLDANRDGIRGAKEKVFANHKMSVTPGRGNTSGKSYTVNTDGAGNYEVPNLPAGNWIVRPADLPSGDFDPVFDTDSGLTRPDWQASALVPNEGEGIADFAADFAGSATLSGANLKLASNSVKRNLRGTLWIDANRDGVKGPKEKVLAGYKLTAKPGAGNSSGKTYNIVTDDAGNYEVANLPEGNWVVTPDALPSTDYERVYDSDSSLNLADWLVLVTMPVEGEAVADFAAALTSSAVAAGKADTLGKAAAATSLAGGLGSTAVMVDGEEVTTLPATGSNDFGQLLVGAFALFLCGAFLVRRGRRIKA
ncbi:MAG: hypothetical protein RJB08_216, partial [Actinomycetota bacterium]